MTDILDEVDEFVMSAPKNKCSIRIWLEGQSDYTEEDIKRASAAKGAAAVARFLKTKGHSGSVSPLRRHLSGLCQCP